MNIFPSYDKAFLTFTTYSQLPPIGLSAEKAPAPHMNNQNLTHFEFGQGPMYLYSELQSNPAAQASFTIAGLPEWSGRSQSVRSIPIRLDCWDS